jgi:hypothetical protein
VTLGIKPTLRDLVFVEGARVSGDSVRSGAVLHGLLLVVLQLQRATHTICIRREESRKKDGQKTDFLFSYRKVIDSKGVFRT